MSATARDTIRNQVMRFADPADMDVGNWDICTDNILKALDEMGFAIVPKDPTPKMLEAAAYKRSMNAWSRDVYQAMLAASQEGK